MPRRSRSPSAVLDAVTSCRRCWRAGATRQPADAVGAQAQGRRQAARVDGPGDASSPYLPDPRRRSSRWWLLARARGTDPRSVPGPAGRRLAAEGHRRRASPSTCLSKGLGPGANGPFLISRRPVEEAGERPTRTRSTRSTRRRSSRSRRPRTRPTSREGAARGPGRAARSGRRPRSSRSSTSSSTRSGQQADDQKQKAENYRDRPSPADAARRPQEDGTGCTRSRSRTVNDKGTAAVMSLAGRRPRSADQATAELVWYAARRRHPEGRQRALDMKDVRRRQHRGVRRPRRRDLVTARP